MMLTLTNHRYMGGFTRPRDLRSSNWWPGGRYRNLKKVYEKPLAAAYSPYTVFLLESRYPIRFGHGRVTSHEHIVGVCREEDFTAVVAKYNSQHAGVDAMKLMDAARWPWLTTKATHVKTKQNDEENVDDADIRKEVASETSTSGQPTKQGLYVIHAKTGHVAVGPSLPEIWERELAIAQGRLVIPEKNKKGKTYAERKAEKVANLASGEIAAEPEAGSETNPEQQAEEMVSEQTMGDHVRTIMPPTLEPMHTGQGSGGPSSSSASGSSHAADTGPSRQLHTSAIARAEEVSTDILSGRLIFAEVTDVTPSASRKVNADSSPTKEEKDQARIEQIRSQYLPTLATTPFWRPLLTVTLATRPMALTHVRLSRAHERGLPFYASINNDDRKCAASFSSRMTSMRIDRMTSLTVQFAQLLDGWRGGFIGIRFSPDAQGRGIDGEDLERGTPFDKRIIKYGVGDWYYRSDEVLEGVRKDLYTEPYTITLGPNGEDSLETFKLDAWGNAHDGQGNAIPWKERDIEERLEDEGLLREWNGADLDDEVDEDMAERDMEGKDEGYRASQRELLKGRKLKLRRADMSSENPKEIARALAERTSPRAVVAPVRWQGRTQNVSAP
jgi:hypothetical protein